MLYKCILIYKNDMLMIKKEHLVSDISKLKKYMTRASLGW